MSFCPPVFSSSNPNAQDSYDTFFDDNDIQAFFNIDDAEVAPDAASHSSKVQGDEEVEATSITEKKR
jgi:hypothetical protein